METLQTLMNEYRCQMKLGIIPNAYKGLMEYSLPCETISPTAILTFPCPAVSTSVTWT